MFYNVLQAKYLGSNIEVQAAKQVNAIMHSVAPVALTVTASKPKHIAKFNTYFL